MIPITGHTQLTALLGSPVAHSISPLMHNEAFHLLDLDYTYLCFNVNEENLETAVMGLKTCGIRGFNLTMPNKNKIVELLDELSPAARLIGAVNTVVYDNGRLTGYNTDGVGYMQAVRDAGYDVSGKPARFPRLLSVLSLRKNVPVSLPCFFLLLPFDLPCTGLSPVHARYPGS